MTESESRTHFRVIRFIHEAGLRLELKAITVAAACCYYHRFYSDYSTSDYEPYMIGATSLFLATKCEEQVKYLRDIVNVCHKVLHPTQPPLEVGETFTALKDSIASAELLFLRCLGFKSLVIVHPHKYVLHYLKSLENWFTRDEWRQFPIARTAWALLKDFYHSPMCIRYQPEHIACAVIYLALLSYGIEVPYSERMDTPWWKAFTDNIRLPIIHQIIKDITATYDQEITVDPTTVHVS